MAEHICLIVDDEPAIRRYVSAILETESLQSLEAENAAQALRIVQKLGGRLDLIISDIKMPREMDGIDLAYSVRNSFPDVPVVLMSGYADEECLKHCTFQLIRKPFGPEAILKAARRAMASHPMTQAPRAVNQ